MKRSVYDTAHNVAFLLLILGFAAFAIMACTI